MPFRVGRQYPPREAFVTDLRPWGFVPSDVVEPYGFCLGRRGEAFVAVLVGKDGQARQYRIIAENGQPKGVEERRFDVGTQSEGCGVDDRAGTLYVGEELKGVCGYALDPTSGAARTQVAAVDGKRLVADVEGVTLIRDGGATYLVVSSQGDSAFGVWQVDGDAPVHRGRFRVAAAGTVDAVSGTDGLDAFSGPIGAYAGGLLAIQDDVDTGGTQNFKLVDWRDVKQALNLSSEAGVMPATRLLLIVCGTGLAGCGAPVPNAKPAFPAYRPAPPGAVRVEMTAAIIGRVVRDGRCLGSVPWPGGPFTTIIWPVAAGLGRDHRGLYVFDR